MIKAVFHGKIEKKEDKDMKKATNLFEKAFTSAITAAVMGFGMLTFFMGIYGVKFDMVHGGRLLSGYLVLCMALWLVFMFPYLKNL